MFAVVLTSLYCFLSPISNVLLLLLYRRINLLISVVPSLNAKAVRNEATPRSTERRVQWLGQERPIPENTNLSTSSRKYYYYMGNEKQSGKFRKYT